MADPRHRTGRDAEDAVARWLAAAGWTILGQRVRVPGGGEADIVARDPGGAVVGVEVRARSTERTGAAIETVDRRRVARIARTLLATASANRLHGRPLRIDLVTVEPIRGDRGRWRLRRVPGIGEP